MTESGSGGTLRDAVEQHVEQGAAAPASLDEQLAAMRAERDQLLQQRELRILEEEIANLRRLPNREESVSVITPSESASRVRKRQNADDSDDENPRRKRSMKPKDPTPYSGLNLRQYRNYIRDCELAQKTAPDYFPTDEDLIAWAMQFLEGDPKETWWAEYDRLTAADEPQEISWVYYSKYILDAQLDPVNRGLDAAIQLNAAAQRKDQTTRSFATYLTTLEDQLPETSEASRIQTLFAKLRPELRDAITTQMSVPTTREGLIIAATTLERSQKKTSGSVAPQVRNMGTGRPSLDKDKRRREMPRVQEKTIVRQTRSTDAPPASGQIVCFTCNKPGHISPDCPDKPKGNPNRAPVGQVQAKKGRAPRPHKAR